MARILRTLYVLAFTQIVFTFCSYGTVYTVINNADAGTGSLRAQIDSANQHPGPDTIYFGLQLQNFAQIIPLASPLPPITDQVLIDGYSQDTSLEATTTTAATLRIELTGSDTVNNCFTIAPQGAFTVIRGLIINAIDGPAIEIFGNHVRIEGNHIGTNSTGMIQKGNQKGITINDADNCQIGGSLPKHRNVISGNYEAGVIIYGPFSNNNRVHGNFIGTNAWGLDTVPNGEGVMILYGAYNNFVGGGSPGDLNVISGNHYAGVYLSDQGTSTNTVLGNRIGCDRDGTFPIPNEIGVLIEGKASNNIIGGGGQPDLNVISGNLYAGVKFEGDSTTGNKVLGNHIGTNLSGSDSLSNDYGVVIGNGASGNIIGSGFAGDRNVISGNASAGIKIYGNGTDTNLVQGNYIGLKQSGFGTLSNLEGVMILDSAQSNLIGGLGPTDFNIIAGNDDYGIIVSNDNTNLNNIIFNFIGNNMFIPQPNSDGILIEDGASYTIIGGNIISGNLGTGIAIEGASTTGTNVYANRIGVSPLGNSQMPNGGNGIEITNGANNNVIGFGGVGNLISENDANGLYIEGPAHDNYVWGNKIGVNLAGNLPLGNANAGIELAAGAKNNIIGGSTDGEKNVVSGNDVGIVIVDQGTVNNEVKGNFIGTDSAATTTIANTNEGIYIGPGANMNIIGGRLTGEGNTISGNTSEGLVIESNNNQVYGNFIGTDPIRTAIFGNGGSGVLVEAGANNNLIGDTIPGSRNWILNNGIGTGGGDGVSLASTAGIGNRIWSNSIYKNSDLGIDLGQDWITQNDNGDGDSGPNDLQNFPVIVYAQKCGTQQIRIEGSLSSSPTAQFFIQFFNSPVAGNGGNGEGESLIGGKTIFTDTAGYAGFVYTFPFTVAFGSYVTATATRISNNCTSEFSEAIYVTGLPAPLNDTLFEYCVGDTIADVIAIKQSSGQIQWYNDPMLINLIHEGDTFTPPCSEIGNYIFYVIEAVKNDSCSSPPATIEIIIQNCDSIGLHIYTAFSPNGDGTNDTWIIDGIRGHNNRVFIYNRWGMLLRTFMDYNNQNRAWDGTNGAGEALPDGTYFYLIDLPERNVSGWVQLTR